MAEMTLLRRATAFGYYDHNQVGVLERVSDHRERRAGDVRQRIWHVEASEVILATGAHERSLVFGNNDLPGVMLASAARGYVNAFAVRPGREAVIFTNNDSAYAVARDLAEGGVSVRALVDVRQSPPRAAIDQLGGTGIDVMAGAANPHARGPRAVTGATMAEIDDAGRPRGSSRDIACDLVCVSGGWSPAVHLHAQARGRPNYDPAIGAFVPGASVQAERSVGAARGTFALTACIEEGAHAGAEAVRKAGFEVAVPPANPAGTLDTAPPLSIWSIGALPGTRH
jgi:sarcosine oxidase subunit alpha